MAQAAAVLAGVLCVAGPASANPVVSTNYTGNIPAGISLTVYHQDPAKGTFQWTDWFFRAVLHTGGADQALPVRGAVGDAGGGVWEVNSDGVRRGDVFIDLPAGADGQLRITSVSGATVSFSQGVGTGATGDPACGDGIDNDGDGLVDMADPGCTSTSDTSEVDPPKACADGIDNDGDGKVDMADPGCTGASDNDEYNAPPPACADGIDNDGDGRIDLADPGCNGDAAGTSESAPPTIPGTIHFGNAISLFVQKAGEALAVIIFAAFLMLCLGKVSWPWLKRMLDGLAARREARQRDLAGRIHAKEHLIATYTRMRRKEGDSVTREQIADKLAELRKERRALKKEWASDFGTGGK